jgi:hypothetical protein
VKVVYLYLLGSKGKQPEKWCRVSSVIIWIEVIVAKMPPLLIKLMVRLISQETASLTICIGSE